MGPEFFPEPGRALSAWQVLSQRVSWSGNAEARGVSERLSWAAMALPRFGLVGTKYRAAPETSRPSAALRCCPLKVLCERSPDLVRP